MRRLLIFLIAYIGIPYLFAPNASAQKNSILMKVTKVYDGKETVEVKDEILLIGDNTLVINGGIYFAELDQRVSKKVFLISLWDEKGRLMILLINKKTGNAWMIKGKKIVKRFIE